MLVNIKHKNTFNLFAFIENDIKQKNRIYQQLYIVKFPHMYEFLIYQRFSSLFKYTFNSYIFKHCSVYQVYFNSNLVNLP